MANPAAQQYDETLVNLFEEQFLPHADSIYRLGLALTLSLDGAALCARRSFKLVSERLGKFAAKDEIAASALLVEACWKAYQEIKSQKFSAGSSAVTKVLGPLSVEARAALVAVDVVGLAPAEAAKSFAWSEKDLRQHLATARRTLVASGAEL